MRIQWFLDNRQMRAMRGSNESVQRQDDYHLSLLTEMPPGPHFVRSGKFFLNFEW
jgi:hypothetical protein